MLSSFRVRPLRRLIELEVEGPASSGGVRVQLLTWRWRVNKGKKSPDELSALDQAVEAVIAGASYKTAGRLYGIPSSTVGYHVVQRGIPRQLIPRSGPKLRSDADVGVGTCRPGGGPPPGGAQRLRPEGSGYPPSIGTSAGERSVMPRERKRRSTALTAIEREEIRVGVELGRVRHHNRRAHCARYRSTIWREIRGQRGTAYLQGRRS